VYAETNSMVLLNTVSYDGGLVKRNLEYIG